MAESLGGTVTPLTFNGDDTSSQGQGESQTFTWGVLDVEEKEDTVAYLSTLLSQEVKLYPPCPDYLSNLSSLSVSADSDPVSESWRRKLCEWCFEVVDHFKFDREAVAIALNYLDRSVSKWTQQFKKPIPKREYQLFAVASLYIAIKIHGETDCLEGPRRKLKIDAFYELSRKQFDVQLIEETERQILEAINWNVNPPTTLKFIATFLFLCPKWQAVGHQATNTHASVLGGIYDVARYLTELSVCQSYFSFSCKNSVVAYSAILVAIESLSRTLPLPFNARDLFIGNIWRTTGLRPNDPDVLMACDMLKRLCPNICNAADIPDELIADKRDDISIDGKTSPICVVDTLEADVRRRKRSRSTASTSTDGSWRPIQNQK